jgi:hypothetical protein
METPRFYWPVTSSDKPRSTCPKPAGNARANPNFQKSALFLRHLHQQ